MSIHGKLVHLRAIERGDIPTFVRWFNDPEVRAYLEVYLPMSQAAEEQWFEQQLTNQSSHILGIETADGKLIGNTGLHAINWKDRKAELEIVIGEKDYWGKGYGGDAIEALLTFAFQQMNLHRIYLHVYAYNVRAQRCYARCGFCEEGRLREAHFHDGVYHDEFVMGLVREDFLKRLG